MEAAALGHAINLVDVYSNSWGPPDSGFYFMEPGPLTKRAIKRGIVEVSIDKYCYCHLYLKIHVLLPGQARASKSSNYKKYYSGIFV